MESLKLENGTGLYTSLQVGNLISVPAGNYDAPRCGLLKNITDSNITINVIMASGTTISTVLYPGWNPEIVKGVKSATANTLQFGY